MAQVDLSAVTVTEGNNLIRQYAEAGEDIDVLNPDARHHIGVGVTNDVTIRVHGSAGYFCAGLTDGPNFIVDNNVGWARPTTCCRARLLLKATPVQSPLSLFAVPRSLSTATWDHAPDRS